MDRFDKIKAGWQSSEFWIGLGGALFVTILSYSGIITEAEATNIVKIIMTYIAARAGVKMVSSASTAYMNGRRL